MAGKRKKGRGRERAAATEPRRRAGWGLGRRAARLCDRGGVLLLWLLILVAPFVIVVTAADAFRLPKLMAFEWGGLASLLAFALAAALAPAGEITNGGAAPSIWLHPAAIAVAPLLAIATLGLATSDHPEHTRAALVDLWIGAACLVGWSAALDRGRLGRLLAGLAIPGSLMAVLAILQFHGGYRPLQFTGGEEGARLGVTSLAGNAGDLASFLVIPGMIAQWGLQRALAAGAARRPLKVSLWAGALLLALWALAATQTVTAILALVVATALFWAIVLPRRRALPAAAAVVVLAVLLVAAVPALRQRAERVGGAVAAGEWNAALTGRLDGWYAALWMAREHPLTGVGHGAYRAEFATAKLDLLADGVDLYRSHADPFFANAHNDLLEAVAEWGLPGALALLWALGVLGWSMRRAGEAAGVGVARPDHALAVALATALLVLALGQFPFHVALVAYPALIALAWIFSGAADAQARAEGPPLPEAGR